MSGKLLASPDTPRTAKRAHHRARRAVRSVCDAPPAKPTGAYVTYDQLGIHRHHRFRSIFGCHPVNFDTDGYPINPRGYHWQFRECTQVGNDLWGGKWPSGVKRRGDPEVNAEQVGRHHFHHGHWYQCRWQAYNSNGDGEWSDWSDPTQFLDGVPALGPTVTVFDTDQHKMRLEWTNPTDPSNSLIHHRNTYENVIQIATGSGFSNVLKQLHVKAGLDGHHVIKWPKPGTTTRWARVGAKTLSGQIEWSPGISSNRADPPTPATPLVSDVTFKHGGKHRVSAKFSYNYDAGGFGDDDVTAAGAHWQYEKTNPTNSDDIHHRSHKRFAPGNSIQGHFFLTHLRPGHKIRVMFWVRDSKGHYAESAWSPPITVYDPRRPGAVRNLVTKKRKGLPSVKATFDPPDRYDGDVAPNPDFIIQDVSHYEADLLDSSAAVVDQNLHLLALHVSFDTVDESGVALGAGGPYKIAIRPIGHGPNINPDGTPGSPPTSNPPAGATPDPPPAPASDGLPPTGAGPTPTVDGGPGYLLARYPAMANADLVTYEIHLGTTSGFLVTAGTKVGETSALQFFIDATQAGLSYGTTYYVKTYPKDRDGYASGGPSAAGSGQMVKVQGFDVAPLAIDTAAIADGAVATAKIADLAVVTAKIAALAVGSGQINDLAVTTGKIQDLAVSTGKIADLAVTTAKILSLSADKITAGTISANLTVTGQLESPAATGWRTTIGMIPVGGTTYALLYWDGSSITASMDTAGNLYVSSMTWAGNSRLLANDVIEVPAAAGYNTPALVSANCVGATGASVSSLQAAAYGAAVTAADALVAFVGIELNGTGGAPTITQINGAAFTPGNGNSAGGWTQVSSYAKAGPNTSARLYSFIRTAAGGAAPNGGTNDRPTFTLSAVCDTTVVQTFESQNTVSTYPVDQYTGATDDTGEPVSYTTGNTSLTTQPVEMWLGIILAPFQSFFGDPTNGFTTVLDSSLVNDVGIRARSASKVTQSHGPAGFNVSSGGSEATHQAVCGLILALKAPAVVVATPAAGLMRLYGSAYGSIVVPAYKGSDGQERLLRGYTLTGHVANANPAASSTYYMGGVVDGVFNTGADTHRIYVPRGGTITAIVVNFFTASTLASGQTSATGLKIRVNGVDQATITSGDAYCTATNNVHANYALSVPVSQGDYISIKWVTPAWVTSPTAVHCHITVYIE